MYSDPAIADPVTEGLASQIAHSVDAAFLGDGSGDVKVPEGLLSVASQSVDIALADVADLDPFISAIFKAQSVGANIDGWVMSPVTAEALSKLKMGAGSNESLLELVRGQHTGSRYPGPEQPERRRQRRRLGDRFVSSQDRAP